VPVVIVSPPGLTRDQYDEVVRRVNPETGRLESPADFPVEGVLAHVAGESPSGFRVVEVWESEDALRRYGELLLPAFQEVGVEGEPEIYPTYNFITA
jgi:hypothetical protein